MGRKIVNNNNNNNNNNNCNTDNSDRSLSNSTSYETSYLINNGNINSSNKTNNIDNSDTIQTNFLEYRNTSSNYGFNGNNVNNDTNVDTGNNLNSSLLLPPTIGSCTTNNTPCSAGTCISLSSSSSLILQQQQQQRQNQHREQSSPVLSFNNGFFLATEHWDEPLRNLNGNNNDNIEEEEHPDYFTYCPRNDSSSSLAPPQLTNSSQRRTSTNSIYQQSQYHHRQSVESDGISGRSDGTGTQPLSALSALSASTERMDDAYYDTSLVNNQHQLQSNFSNRHLMLNQLQPDLTHTDDGTGHWSEANLGVNDQTMRTSYTTTNSALCPIDRVLRNLHYQTCTVVLRRTSSRFRLLLERVVLIVSVCGFGAVFIAHATFVHRIASTSSICNHFNYNNSLNCSTTSKIFDHDIFINHALQQIQVTSVARKLLLQDQVAQQLEHLQQLQHDNSSSSTVILRKRNIPLTCLPSIDGFDIDADLTHLILFDETEFLRSHEHLLMSQLLKDAGIEFNLHQEDDLFAHRVAPASSFVVHRRVKSNLHTLDPVKGPLTKRTTIVYELDHNDKLQYQTETATDSTSQVTTNVDIPKSDNIDEQLLTNDASPTEDTSTCSITTSSHTTAESNSTLMMTVLSFLLSQIQGLLQQIQSLLLPKATTKTTSATTATTQLYFSYSKSHAYVYMTPELSERHNVHEQYIFVSVNDLFCFGEPFLQKLVFNLLGPDTVMINWLLGLLSLSQSPTSTLSNQFRNQQHPHVGYIYNPRNGVLIDLSSKQYDYVLEHHYHYHHPHHKSSYNSDYDFTNNSYNLASLRYWYHQLSSKITVLIKASFLFFVTTTLVSFTLHETQTRMLSFTHQLQQHVRMRQPVINLVTQHIVGILVFVPIMVGMIFFLIQFYRGDKFLAFMVLSFVWLCESFSVICLRTRQGVHFFPRIFFLLFTVFHIYCFSFPFGFSYSAFGTMFCFIIHTMMFFLHRFELLAVARLSSSSQNDYDRRLDGSTVSLANDEVVPNDALIDNSRSMAITPPQRAAPTPASGPLNIPIREEHNNSFPRRAMTTSTVDSDDDDDDGISLLDTRTQRRIFDL